MRNKNSNGVPVVKDRNLLVRFYRQRSDIWNGTSKFPEA